MGDLSDNLLMLRSRTTWFAREHRETPQHLAFGRKYRRGPTRAQPVRQGDITIAVPQPVSGNVADDDRLSQIDSSPARPRLRPDGSAVKIISVTGRQAGSCAMPKPVVIR